MSKENNAKKGTPVTGKTLWFMLKTAWKQKPSLFLAYALLLIADVAKKMQVIFLPKLLLDELMLILQGEPLSAHLQLAVTYAAAGVMIQFLARCLSNVAIRLRGILQEWFDEYFALLLSEHAMGMDFEHTEDPAALDQVEKAKEGISWYSGGVVGILNFFYDIVMNAVVLAGVVAVIITTCPLLLPVQLLSLLLITMLNARNNRIELESFKKLSKANRVFGYVLYELADFTYGKEIRLYDSADMMCQKMASNSKEQTEVWADMARKQCKNSWGMDVVNSFRDGISYFYIGYLALKRVLSVGDFSMCVSAASSLYWSLHGIVRACQEITKRCSYAYQLIKFLDYPAAMTKGTRAVTGTEHEITFSHVSFRYPRSETFVLRDINLTIRSGEHLSIVGLNGAGKTTFIKLLCRLYDVTEGEILIDGVNIKEYSEEEYRKLFAVVFQDFKLFAFSLRDNIALSATGEDEEINRVLQLSGFYEDAKKLEHGLDTMLYKSFDEHGTELSGGQKQKTAISRALYRDAPVVILDEPTAALDPIAEYDIYRQFNKLVGGKTAIYISHRLSSCKFCDKIAVFAEDTIKEYGAHEELVAKKDGIYAEMFAAQAQYYVENA